jgi:hypothetical protein
MTLGGGIGNGGNGGTVWRNAWACAQRESQYLGVTLRTESVGASSFGIRTGNRSRPRGYGDAAAEIDRLLAEPGLVKTSEKVVQGLVGGSPSLGVLALERRGHLLP